MNDDQLDLCRRLAGRLRVDSIPSSTSAGSGHPTSSLSAADLMAVLLLVGHLSSLFRAFGIASAGKYLGRITRGVWLLCVCLATPVPRAGVRLRLDEPAVLVPALGT